MTIITIKQKESNSGSIYDIESEHFDISINFGNRYKYAVVCPSYYGIDPTRHTTEELAIRQYKKLENMDYEGVTIIDTESKRYNADQDNLILIDKMLK